MGTSISNGENGAMRPLFGGAFSCFIPTNSLDASSVREVPDNQEVFCHHTTDQSLMIDILEYQSQVQGIEAVKYHFNDLVQSNECGDDFEVTLVEAIHKTSLCFTECSEAWFLSGRQAVSKFKEESSAKNLIEVHIVLYRLPQYETDIVVVFNSPVVIAKESSSSDAAAETGGSSEAWSLEMFKQIACTLTMHNSGLFGEET